MLQASPSLGLAKFIWSKPLQSNSAPMTVSANEITKPAPLRIDATNIDLDDTNSNIIGVSQMTQAAEVKNSTGEEKSAPKMVGLREFWSHHMKATEDKWKQYLEQISSNQQHHHTDYDTETGEVDWGAVRERIVWRWQLSQEKPENMSSEEWQKLQETSVNRRPWFIYKNCGLYSRMFSDPENRPIFQEFDFF